MSSQGRRYHRRAARQAQQSSDPLKFAEPRLGTSSRCREPLSVATARHSGAKGQEVVAAPGQRVLMPIGKNNYTCRSSIIRESTTAKQVTDFLILIQQSK